MVTGLHNLMFDDAGIESSLIITCVYEFSAVRSLVSGWFPTVAADDDDEEIERETSRNTHTPDDFLLPLCGATQVSHSFIGINTVV